MKISAVKTTILALPADEPLANAPENPGGKRVVVAVQVFTDAGVVGIGITYLGAALTRTLGHAVQQLGELLIEDDPTAIDAALAKLHNLASGAGPGGIFTLALSAIEIALWDISGKAQNLPLWRMVGASGEPVPTYASGALMRGISLDMVEASTAKLVELGFKAMKFQLALPGKTSPEIEMERARLIRSIAGEDAVLMCDINQRWDFDTALSLGRQLEEVRLDWLEDPMAHDDYEGLARLAAELETKIAVGEYVYGITPFRHMIAAGSLDVVMIDPFRAGGIGSWLRIAKLAHEHGYRVVSHLAPEIQVHLIGAISNGWIVEYMPWFNMLYEEVIWPQKGMLAMPQKPGLGVAFNENVFKRYGVGTLSS